MAETSTIEWTGATWNPITGCSVTSPGCTNCYAMRLAGTRLQNHPSRAGLTQDSKAGPVWTGEVRLNEAWLDQPLRWGRPRMIFVCAHGDLFHESVPDEWIDRVFAVIALATKHTFQVLTKRAARMRRYCTDPKTPGRVRAAAAALNERHPTRLDRFACWPLPNVWKGVSAEDQQRADERIPHLLATPAAVRWVSAEPLLGAINMTRIAPGEGGWLNSLIGTKEDGFSIPGERARIDWIVAGGESGPGARPMHPAWARALRDQCAEARVPFFFKQWGEWLPVHESGYASWSRAPGKPTAGARGLVSGYRPGRGPSGLEGRAWPSIWPFLMPPDPGPIMIGIGKALAGRLLDGVEHNGMPQR
jgi:protein gp37